MESRKAMNITTKLSAGDFCWIMANNKPKEVEVTRVVITHERKQFDTTRTQIQYFSEDGAWICDEATAYATKAELLASL
jgi:hypothetical protein